MKSAFQVGPGGAASQPTEARHPPTVNRITVLLVSPFPPPVGGIGRWAVQVTQAGSNHPDQVAFRCLDISPRWRAVYDIAPWKRVVGGSLQMARDFLRFLGMLRCRPDVVHLNSHGQLATFRDIPILAACRLLRIPSVYHMHFGRIPEIARKRTPEWKRLRLALRLARAIVALDRRTCDALHEALPGACVHLVPNCIGLPAAPDVAAAPARPYLAFLGHVLPSKGIVELLQSWTAMAAPSWRLLVVGTVDTDYRTELQQRFPAASVEFLGEQSHDRAMAWLASSEGLVLPSHTEGFPNVVMEAMAMGKPVVATDVGAIPDMLSGGCGLVVPPRDAGALRTALETVIANPDLRQSMGERGRTKVTAEYSVEAVFDRLMAVWRGVLRRPCPS